MYRNYHKAADRVVAKGCHAKCRYEILCNLVTTNFADQENCDRIQDSTDDLLIKVNINKFDLYIQQGSHNHFLISGSHLTNHWYAIVS